MPTDPTIMPANPPAPEGDLDRLLDAIVEAANLDPGTAKPANDVPAEAGRIDVPYTEKEVPDSRVLEDIERLERESGQVRRDEEYEWQLAWAYYNGKHWGRWDEHDNLVDLDEEDVPHLVLNYILHLVQTRLAHLIKNRPILQGLPGRPDERARNATRLAVRVMEAYWRKLRLAKKLQEALLWTLVCGKCFWKSYWDPSLGKERRLPGAVPLGDGAAAAPAEYRTREGDLCVQVVFPHEVLVDVGASDIARSQLLLHSTFLPVAEVLRRWGDELTQEEKDQLSSGAANEPARDDAVRRDLEGLSKAAGLSLEGRVLVKELWARHSEDRYPRGLCAVVVMGRVVQKLPTPEGYPEIPFVEFDEIRTNGFWSTSTARQLIDLNQVINIQISQQEHRRKVLRYKTLIPQQALIDKDAFDRTDTEIIDYWAPHVPTHLAPPETRQGEVEIRNSLINIVKEIGGSFDVLAGRTSGEVRSGRQTAYLQEYAGTVLALVAQLVEWALTDFGNQALQILQKKVREDRFESFIGRDRRVQVLSFKGADLEGCAEIIVQPSASLMMSRAEKMDRIEHWMEKGWLSPDVGLRLLDLGDFDTEIYSEEEQDRQNADEMIYRLESVPVPLPDGTMQAAMALAEMDGNVFSERYTLRALSIEAFPFDNHAIHRQQIDRVLRKTRTYREWPPTKRDLVDALYDWHLLLEGGGPVETPLSQPLPAGALTPGLPVPPPTGSDGRPAAPSGNGSNGAQVPSTGSPQALQGKIPSGIGGIADPHVRAGVPESGAETAAGLPGVPVPPGPGQGPARGLPPG